MAEQQPHNPLTPETPGEETFAAAEQLQSSGGDVHRERSGTENASANRSSTHKGTTGEVDAHASNGVNGRHGTNGVPPEKTRTRKKRVDIAVSPSVSTGETTRAPRGKRAAFQKTNTAKKRKKGQPLQKDEALPQETGESARPEAPVAAPLTSMQAGIEAARVDEAPCEPDLDPTPVKARETSQRSLASIEAELDALLAELMQAEPRERADMQASSSVDTLSDIPDTPVVPAIELAKAPETPLPTVDEEDALAGLAAPVAGKEAPDTPVIEEEVEAIVIAGVETQPAVEPEQLAPAAAAPSEDRPRLRWRPLRRVAMLLAFFLFVASSLLLWQNVNQTHLYLYAIDPGDGRLLARQDLGGYASVSALSNAAQDSSSLFMGVSSTPSEQQQVLALTGSDTSWHVTQQFAAARGRSTLSVGPGHVLAVEDGSGLQVMTGDGRVLWQVAGDVPLLGAHPFTPAFAGSTVYTITSARRGMVGAYDVHSGSPRWSIQLDDTLNYAPPVLLAGDTLYVAGDHTLYALNTITGGTHWKAAMPARTLLYSQASSSALIAAGASGLAAFDPQNGNLLWSFNGQPDSSSASGEGNTLTPAQFYQAGLLAASNTVYATGLVWDTRQLQQQLWLFAVDASSGKQMWSKPIGTGFTGADGGRVFAPFIEAAHKLIVIEQAQSDGSHTVSAYDTGDGFQHWHVRLAAVSASAPALVQLTSNSLGVFSAQSDAGLTLHSDSALRSLLFVLAVAGFSALLLLWILPLRGWLSKTGRRLRRLPHTLLAPLRAPLRLWRFSRLLFALTLVAVLIGAALAAYMQLSQQYSYLQQVGGTNGRVMWQQRASHSTTLAGVDSSGALLVTGAADSTSELRGLNSNGSPLWTLPSGEGTFSLPAIATQAGTVLAVLHGPAALPYHYAANDPAYPNPLAHYFALCLLDSQTGKALWRTTISKTGAEQNISVLGEDAQFIYIAGLPSGQNQVAQLMAVDKMGGTIAWRFYGPREQSGGEGDAGAILTGGTLVYWQVESAIYALNPQTGQVEWRAAIPEVNAQVAPLEEGQMAAGQGLLLIRRSDMYHALGLVTGVERWTLSGLGVDSAQAPGGILADGNRFIVYGGGSIEALDVATHSVLWKHINLVAISNVSLSPDGSIVYAVVFNNMDGGVNRQALVAFDANSNLIHWSFQPGAQARLVNAGARIIYNARGMIYLVSCFASSTGTCTRQILYGVDEKTGKARWQIEARRIYALQANQDGQMLTFQTSSSAWDSLKALFKG